MKHVDIKHTLHRILQMIVRLLSVRAGLYFSQDNTRKQSRG